jgi:hypothetical protein
MDNESKLPRRSRASCQDSTSKTTDSTRTSVQNVRGEMPPGLSERSIFHEPWWLDAATNGAWHVAEVKHGNTTIGEMPYTLAKKGLWQISTLPPLTRTLGPVIKPHQSVGGDREWTQRLGIARDLIAQLPKCARFHQLMDPRVSEAEALAFRLEGFTVKVAFTLIADGWTDEATAFAALKGAARTAIRRAQECLTVRPIDSAKEFLDFYDANLAARKRTNVYGAATMGRLLNEVLNRQAGTLIGAFDAQGSLVASSALIWDSRAAYYFLTARRPDAHGGAVSLMLWTAMRIAGERGLSFDFDGVSTTGILKFLGGFGGRLVRRFEIERTMPVYGALRTTLHSARTITAFASPARLQTVTAEPQRI